MLPALEGSTLVQLIFAVKVEVNIVVVKVKLTVFMVSDKLLVIGILTPKTKMGPLKITVQMTCPVMTAVDFHRRLQFKFHQLSFQTIY